MGAEGGREFSNSQPSDTRDRKSPSPNRRSATSDPTHDQFVERTFDELVVGVDDDAPGDCGTPDTRGLSLSQRPFQDREQPRDVLRSVVAVQRDANASGMVHRVDPGSLQRSVEGGGFRMSECHDTRGTSWLMRRRQRP